MRISSIIVTAALITTASAYDNPLVHLDYASLKGKYDSTYNLSYFRKIPFASPPTAPEAITSLYDTDQDFDMCPQRTVNGSEDCLYLGLFSRPWQKQGHGSNVQGLKEIQGKRPVLVVFYGGAFIQGSASFTIPPSSFPVLNASTLNDYVVVYPNYRVNSLGFLPGKLMKESTRLDANTGLLDQQYALKWVSKYIHLFGGDPGNVTIWGQSAGAGSVVGQVLANGRHGQPKLFKKALASSPFWPKMYEVDSLEAEGVFDTFVNLIGCASTTKERNGKYGDEMVDCLKNVDLQVIREASLNVSMMNRWTTSSYTWAPVIDGEFLVDGLSEIISRGLKLETDFIWGMYNTHEGENFVPPGLKIDGGRDGYNSSLESLHGWLEGFVPRLSKTQIRAVNDVYYPVVGSTEMIGEYNSSFVRAGLIYRDLVLACPAYWVASAASRNGYLGEYAISPATHGSDTIYWNRLNTLQKTNPVVYQGYAGAFASFFQTGDPNAHKLTNSSESGVPLLKKTGEEFVIVDDGFENIRIDQLKRRCNFWRKLGRQIPV
ncbi:uncharacterized protein N7469_003831 [Penicillium citrinum]|uniref:Carboxylic ester hydrolase n=1 Tax=Penicillium citrinum TaxID=5077 RepID=A0A9W9P3F1_PENCI|nr:uncharacterized protein N7469_003831 [Penicillium citrinum]KAJ5234663.1 hypothetical protein N7469_003831 [Penicillium citrinum]